MIEIKMQGLGGQGIVMAVDLMASIMSKAGYHVQSFSQYGSERRGGRVESYLRASRGQVLTHSGIYEADYLILAHKAFLNDPKLASNIKESGTTILVNAPGRPEDVEIRGKTITLVCLDAERVAIKHGVRLPSGTPVINTSLVGGLAALFPDIDFTVVAQTIREKNIPALERNISAAEEAFLQVKGRSRNLAEDEAVVGGGEFTEQQQVPVFSSRISPCEAQCPAGVPIRRVLALVQKRKFRDAARVLKAENPFPAISGRACFHPCETGCNRKEFDEPLSINAIERAVSEHATVPVGRKRIRSGSKRVAVIGSGPAGMTCAYFLRMLGHRVTVYEALPVAGGIPRIAIPAYRLPPSIIDAQMKEVLEGGVEVKLGVQVDKEVFATIMSGCDACFVAVGAHRSAALGIPGEEGLNVVSGLEFLKAVALGKEVHLREKVAVIGGGNTAIDAARTARRLGASEVTVIYRRSEEEMPAYWEEVVQAADEQIRMVYLAAPVQMLNNNEGVSIECTRMALGEKKSEGRKEVHPVKDSCFTLDFGYVITAVGERVHVPFLPPAIRKRDSLIEVDHLGRTSVKGIYAGGDATTFSRSIAHAIGSGKRSAIGIDLFLRGKESECGQVEYGRSMAAYMARQAVEPDQVVTVSDLTFDYFTKFPRTRARVLPPESRVSHFDEITQGISRKVAIAEAARCFRCGTCLSCGNCYIFCPDMAVHIDDSQPLPTVNQEVCKTCGICINECPTGVIRWEKS